MKNDALMPSVIQMEKEVLQGLLQEVKETVARDIVFPVTRKRSFTAAEMWNIHRKRITARHRLER